MAASSLRRKLAYGWDLILVLLTKEIKLRYRGTAFGILWSLANPVAFTAVLYVAFKRVLRIDIENYPLFILSALFPWQWLSNSISAAPMLFISNAPLIKKLPFPRGALCAAVVLNDMIHFSTTLPVFAIVAILSGGGGPSPVWVVGIPLLMLIQALLTLSAVVIIAALNTFLRDLEQLVRVFLLLLFYVTPVLYSASMVPEGLRWLLVLNPFSPLLISWRSLLIDHALSPYLFVAIIHTTAAVALAISVYRKTQYKLAEVV